MLGGFENCAIFIVWPFTNYVFALWTWRFWTARSIEDHALKYQTTKLHIVIIMQITIMWIPGLSWYLALTPFLHTIWYLLPWRYRYDCSGGIQLLQVHTTEERARSLNKSLRGESPSYPTNPLSSPLNSSIEPLSPPKRMPRIRCEAFFVIGRL